MWRHLFFAVLSASGAAAQTPLVGARAPEFSLEVLGGGRIRLSQFRGRPVLVNFWATWCVPCRTEMPAIIVAYEDHRSAGLVVVAVNLTDQERMREVRRFLDEVTVPFPVLLESRKGPRAVPPERRSHDHIRGLVRRGARPPPGAARLRGPSARPGADSSNGCTFRRSIPYSPASLFAIASPHTQPESPPSPRTQQSCTGRWQSGQRALSPPSASRKLAWVARP